MRVSFSVRDSGPANLVAEAELHLTEQPLNECKLVGFSLWKGEKDQELYVTFPSRPFGAGSDRRYFDFLRSEDGTAEAVKRVKQFILDAFKEQHAPKKRH